jgi:hypothetical protein
MINKIYGILALLMFSGLANAFTVYTDKTDWENALSGAVVITEDFEDQTMIDGLASYATPDGTYTEFDGFNLIVPPPPTFNNTQVFEELVDDNGGTTVWSFSSPFIAFGGDWDLSPAGPGTGLEISIDGQIQNVIIPNSYDGGFWGFIADSAFSTVELLKPSAVSGSELYHLDNMVFATVVPLPAAIWLLVSGFIGLLGYKKRFSH